MKKNGILGCSLGFCLTAGISCAQAPEQNRQKPNVLFIIMDDMNDWAHYLAGNNQALTPNLDRLAARGVSFSHAYTSVPLCNPSRTAMLSGIQPFVTGVYNNRQPIPASTVADNSLWMPQHFRNNGYTTLIAGKIYHTKPSPGIMQRMWDDMSNIDGGYGPFARNSSLPEELRAKWQDFEMWTGPDTDFPDVRNSQKVIDFLGQPHEKPFFVAMGFYRPHTPWTAPRRYFDQYNLSEIKRPVTLPDDLADIPPYAVERFIGQRQIDKQRELAKNGNYWEQMIRAYLACISFADDRIGMILDALDRSAYADNTIIVLVGDNGYHLGEKERWAKSALWREACHVPLIIAGPRSGNRISKGKCEAVVSSLDIYPTLVEACNLPEVKGQLAGNSLLPVLKNTESEWNKPCITAFLPGNFTLHAGRWNFIRYADGSRELYNIAEDENEFINLAENPAFRQVADSLNAFLPASWHPGVAQTPNPTPAMRRRNASQNPGPVRNNRP